MRNTTAPTSSRKAAVAIRRAIWRCAARSRRPCRWCSARRHRRSNRSTTCSSGRYRQLPLPRRADQAAAPRLALIDLRAHAVHAGLAGPVIAGHRSAICDSDGQVLVYLNRRGYAPTLLCTQLRLDRAVHAVRCAPDGASRSPHSCAVTTAARSAAAGALRPLRFRGQAGGPGHRARRRDAGGDVSGRAAGAARSRHGAPIAADVRCGDGRILLDGAGAHSGRHPDGHQGPSFPGRVAGRGASMRTRDCSAPTFAPPSAWRRPSCRWRGAPAAAARAGEVLIQTEYPEHPLLQSLLAAAATRPSPPARWRSAPLRAGRHSAAWRCCALSGQSAPPALRFPAARARERRRRRPGVRLLGPGAPPRWRGAPAATTRSC